MGYPSPVAIRYFRTRFAQRWRGYNVGNEAIGLSFVDGRCCLTIIVSAPTRHATVFTDTAGVSGTRRDLSKAAVGWCDLPIIVPAPTRDGAVFADTATVPEARGDLAKTAVEWC